MLTQVIVPWPGLVGDLGYALAFGTGGFFGSLDWVMLKILS